MFWRIIFFTLFTALLLRETIADSGDEDLSTRISGRCDEYQAETIKNIHYKAINKIEFLISRTNLEINYGLWENWRDHTKARLIKAKRVLECGKDMMTYNIKYICGDCFWWGPLAKVHSWDFSHNTIRICEHGLYGSNEHKIALFIHEATHHCGTGDADYFYEDNPPGDSDFNNHPGRKLFKLYHQNMITIFGGHLAAIRGRIWASGKWHTIADTYYYWARHGFCIPEVDC
ncbi:MAG: hypothetical protein OXB84_00030 [Halobacteriovoraceae bacterium]|nr:hypothetical protein [Halobacteriovoraceae bacterium]